MIRNMVRVGLSVGALLVLCAAARLSSEPAVCTSGGGALVLVAVGGLACVGLYVAASHER